MPKREACDAGLQMDDLSTNKKLRPSRKITPVSFLINEAVIPTAKVNSVNNRKTTVEVHKDKQPVPSVNKFGELCFPDYPEFKPNMTPKEIIQAGSFGGTYFRPIYSTITGTRYADVWQEFPDEWFENLTISRAVARVTYDDNVNTYAVNCGQSLEAWEQSGWITEVDPYGWFQWYCRFYLGRRCSDDARQISRGLGVIGSKGRWRNNLINKCLRSQVPCEESVNDFTIAPKIRQLLQHWGYRLTLRDLQTAQRKK